MTFYLHFSTSMLRWTCSGQFIQKRKETSDMNTGMSSRDLERYITQVMLDMGIPAHLKGYHYLREAILISEQDMNTLTSVTKLLYPSIAKRYHTTETKVERAIRNAIEVSWKRGNMQAFRQMFGYSFLTGQHRPTNSEYIYQLADKIRTDLSESS